MKSLESSGQSQVLLSDNCRSGNT